MTLAVFYSFARSGGTLVNRCLGAIPGNLVLSEVNPHGALVPVEVQARDWLGLVGPGEFEILAGKGYGAKIRWLSEAAANQGRHLVVRDWPALNFLSGLFSEYFQPSLLLEQQLYLTRHGLEPGPAQERMAPGVVAEVVDHHGRARGSHRAGHADVGRMHHLAVLLGQAPAVGRRLLPQRGPARGVLPRAAAGAGQALRVAGHRLFRWLPRGVPRLRPVHGGQPRLRVLPGRQLRAHRGAPGESRLSGLGRGGPRRGVP